MKTTRQSGWSAARRGWPRGLCVALVAAGVLCGARAARAVQPGDTEPNEAVDLRDLLAIRNAFGQSGAPGFVGADLDGDGVVDQDDLVIWRANFPFLGTPLTPYLFVHAPLDGTLLGDRRPTVVIDYGATTLNVDPDTLQVTIDGVDRSAEALKSFTNAVVGIDAALGDGPHYVEATIEDTAGTPGTDRSDFTITPITLLPRATPRVGPAPLEVTFSPDVVWADSAPAWYRWDWEDDAVYDIVDPRPDRRTFTFLEEGLHTVRFQVQQSDGTLTDATIDIAVTESFASVSPSNGTGPLTVFLHGIAADLTDPIVLYEWDFDYTGTFSPDYTSTTNPNTAHVYVFPGVYTPRFRATYDSGALIEYPVVQDEVRVNGAGQPTAIAAASQGASALTVNFAGSGSDNGSITLYEWDFDNDGSWDYSSPTSGNVAHTYPTAGARVAALRVTDNDTNTAVDRVRFETFAPATLEILDDTIDPGETTTIRTNTTIGSTVWLYVRAADQTLTTGEIVKGRVIRTLVDHQFRAAGTYDDAWDGRDDRGEYVHPDAYYAVLQYTYPGRTDTLDLADTTGDVHYFATRIPPVETQLDPIADDPLPMLFELTTASRASLYVLPGGTNRTATIFDNLALGAGQYLYFWSGFDSAGHFAPSATYLWSVNAWTLGDNAIVVGGQPAVDDIQITPNFLSPTDRPLGSATTEIAYTLNKSASTYVNIISEQDNVTLRAFQQTGLAAGSHTVVWDGKTADGRFVAPGYYRMSIAAIDDRGNLSIEREGVVKVRY